MSNIIEKMQYGENPVRIIKKGNEAWFVAKDVCDILGIDNSRDAVSSLDADERASVGITDTSSSSRNTIPVTAINESGLYALIFKSRKEEAKAFRKWVTSEVLPAIRKTGTYQAQPKRKMAQFQYGTNHLTDIMERHPNEMVKVWADYAMNEVGMSRPTFYRLLRLVRLGVNKPGGIRVSEARPQQIHPKAYQQELFPFVGNKMTITIEGELADRIRLISIIKRIKPDQFALDAVQSNLCESEEYHRIPLLS